MLVQEFQFYFNADNFTSNFRTVLKQFCKWSFVFYISYVQNH